MCPNCKCKCQKQITFAPEKIEKEIKEIEINIKNFFDGMEKHGVNF